jgi:hypothetical protein
MKKIIYSFVIALTASALIAQEAADKKVQAGIVLGTGANFTTMNTKTVGNGGSTANLMIGANVNIGFNNNIGLSTGAEFDFDNVKYKFSNPTFYEFEDLKILRKSEESNAKSLYQITERKQQAIYLTIPTMVIFRTNYIGYFRYFGKIGLRNSFLLSARSNDKGNLFGIDPNNQTITTTPSDNTNMKLNSGNDMLFYRGSVGLSGGAEWNFVGSTCLSLEVGYFYGFTPLYYNNKKEDKRTLYNLTSNLDKSYFNNAAHQSQLLFKISILF